MTKVKICGLRSEEDISYANELKPDFVGFVFYKKSFRYVSPERAAILRSLLAREIPAVGVFVDEPLENVVSLLEKGIIQMVQLHGHEDEKYIGELKMRCQVEVIKAIVVRSEADVEDALDSMADYLLFDGGLGEGRSFDWKMIKDNGRPIFLAGGLTPDNVATAISHLHPFAVDASSSLETDHKKDVQKMREFLNEVRKTNE